MDAMGLLQAVMDFIKQFATQYSTQLGGIGVALIAVYGLYQKYQNIIAWVTLRVEKDAQDGWTNDEKEQFAIDLYFTQLLPILPLYLKWLAMIPRFIIEPIIRKIVKKTCEKSAQIQNNAPQVPPAQG
jgi:hypothetical protein